MGTLTTKNGVHIFYKDWGSGQPVVFSHGWPPPHGLHGDYEKHFNADLLAFLAS